MFSYHNFIFSNVQSSFIHVILYNMYNKDIGWELVEEGYAFQKESDYFPAQGQNILVD